MLSRAVLIVAGGNGVRFGSSTPKQYHTIADKKSVLEHTVDTFKTHPLIDVVCIVVGQDHEIKLDLPYTYGGKIRQESVKNGLNFLKQYNPKHVLIHDAVRPFVSHNLISDVLHKLEVYEAVDVGLPIVDTIKRYDGGVVVPRESLYATQTPQGFHFDLILDLHQKAVSEYTDDVSLYLASGRRDLGIVPGNSKNIKITYKEDLE